jgi:hypothetical protein
MDWPAKKECKHLRDLQIYENYFVPPQSNQLVKHIVSPQADWPVNNIVPPQLDQLVNVMTHCHWGGQSSRLFHLNLTS